MAKGRVSPFGLRIRIEREQKELLSQLSDDQKDMMLIAEYFQEACLTWVYAKEGYIDLDTYKRMIDVIAALNRQGLKTMLHMEKEKC